MKQVKYTKAQLLTCAKYDGNRDVLSAVLEDDKLYTHNEAEQRIKEYLGKKVD